MFRIATTFFLFAVLLNAKAFSQNYWEFANSPHGATIDYLAVHPNGDIFGVSNVLYVSGDDGANWTIVQSNKKYLGAMFILPDGTMFSTLQSEGMYKSTDKGLTWTIVNSSISNQTYTCWARTSIGTLYSGAGSGVFKSTDNGNNWTVQQNGMTDRNTRGVVVNPSTGHVFAATGGGVFRSTNSGTNWTTMAVGSSQFYAVAADSTGRIFAAKNGGVATSEDDGGTWSLSKSGLVDTLVLKLTVASNGSVFAATPTGIYRSVDHGATWVLMNNGLKGININAIAIKNGTTIIAGTRAGAFISTDNGDSWTRRIGGMKAMNASDPVLLDGGRIVLGNGNSGTYMTTDNGASWPQQTDNVPPQNIITSLRLGANTFLVGTYYGGIWKTTDNGDSWAYVALNGQGVPSILKHSNGTIFAATGDGVKKSTDNGATWDATGLSGEYLNAMVIDNAGGVIAGGNRGAYRSSDLGAHFDHIVSDTGSGAATNFHIVQALAVDSHGTLYNVTGYTAMVGMKGLHKSTDNGTTWTHLATPDSNINKLAFNALDELYGGLDTGVIRSKDGGAHWANISAGLDSATSVEYIEFASNGTAYLGTNHGVFRSVLSTTSVREQRSSTPASFTLGQNYPNPFNPMTNIDFTLTKQGYVTLKVFNVLGQEIASLVHETLKAGTYTATWIATDAPSGSYYYTLSSGGQSVVRKLMLVK